MRNPKNSWDRSDSWYGCRYGDYGKTEANINFKSLSPMQNSQSHLHYSSLMQTLIRAGSEHRKFLRQMFVAVDITAPLYWWKEFDTYKIGTTANSTSTMHKLASTSIMLDCFETDDYDESMIFDRGIDDRVDCPYRCNYHLREVIGHDELRYDTE